MSHKFNSLLIFSASLMISVSFSAVSFSGIAFGDHHETHLKVGNVIANPLCNRVDTQTILPLAPTAVTAGKTLWKLSCSSQATQEYILEAVTLSQASASSAIQTGFRVVEVIEKNQTDRFFYENSTEKDFILLGNTPNFQAPVLGNSPGDLFDVFFFAQQGQAGCAGSVLMYRWVKYNPLQDAPPVRSPAKSTGFCLANLKATTAQAEPLLILDQETSGTRSTILAFVSVEAKDEMVMLDFDWSRLEVSRIRSGAGLLPAECGMELTAARLIPGQDRAAYLLGSQVLMVAGFEPGGASARTLYDGRLPGAAAICGRGRPTPSKFSETFLVDHGRGVVQYFHSSQKLHGRRVLIESAY